VELLSKGRNNWERGECATGIKVGPVFLLQLMTSFQIRVGETGGVHHVGHAVYCRLDRCCRTQPTRNHYRVHISRILKQDYYRSRSASDARCSTVSIPWQWFRSSSCFSMAVAGNSQRRWPASMPRVQSMAPSNIRAQG